MMRGNIIGRKIRTLRDLKGYSQEYIAGKLEIAQNTYSKLEADTSKLNIEMLEKIASILEVTVNDLISEEPMVLNFNGINHGAQGNFELIENFHSGQKELYEKIIVSKDEEIGRLNKIVESLLKK
jgi:transcriptional regulator with XRE-family HTH domain